MKLEFRIIPDDDATLKDLARNALRSLSDAAPEERTLEISDEERKAIDPVAVSIASAILAIPGTLLALTQLLDRLDNMRDRKEIRDRIEPLISAAGEDTKQVALSVGDQTLFLGDHTVDQVMDALKVAGIEAKNKL